MPGERKGWARVAAVQVIKPPGGYRDGTQVYIRVDKNLAGDTWPLPGYDIELNDWRCALDPVHHYVRAHNSHSAFVYIQWIIERGVPGAALTVVRLADDRTRT